MDNGKLALNKSAQSQSQDLCWGDTSSSLKRPKGRTARTKKFKITPHEINKHKNSTIINKNSPQQIFHTIHWFLLSSPAKRGKFPCPGELPSHMHTARLGATEL